ncbi:MAG TPA: exodeoxyribonuclease VII small subunit [Candidatus Paceibacterota bacterium]|nr:exodeoxyribonuclease VII small subunit [Candidatus Paceibacterota bacterium]
MPKHTTESISPSLEKLEKIVRWLDEQDHVDVEEGLRKVKEGAELVKSLRARLKAVANEFEEVKKGLEDDENP